MIKNLKVPGDLKKRIRNGLLIGCMALVSLLVVDPDETKAVTTSDIYWNGSTAYVATQAGLNEACNRNMTADIYLLNDITLVKTDPHYMINYPTGISVYGVKTLHGNGHTLKNGIRTDDGDANADVKENGAPVFNVANTLTLENVVINGGNSKYRSAIVVNFGGTVNVKSGTYITGCKSWDCGSGTRGGHGIWCREGGVINVYDGSIYGNEQSGIGSSGGTVSVAGGNIYNNGNNGISSYGTLYFHGGIVNQNKGAGIYVGGGNRGLAYINGGLIAGNRSEAGVGIAIQSGKVEMNGGTVSDFSNAGVYVENGYGTFTMNGGEIYRNTSTGISNVGTTTVNSGRIHDNGENGILSSTSLTIGSGASGTEICNNGSNGVYSSGTLTMTGGYVHSNGASGIGNFGTGTISGGDIRYNKGNSNVANGGTLTVSGGSIHGTAVNGVVNSGNLTVTGGSFYDSTGAGIFHAGTTTITGGSFRSNGHDVQHFGQENSGNLVIEGGAESVWLPTVGRYVVTHSGRRLVINMPTDCYKRGKIMVRTDSAETAQNVTSNLSFRDLNAFTKRAYGNDVVVWDRYKPTSKNYKYEGGSWNYFGTD